MNALQNEDYGAKKCCSKQRIRIFAHMKLTEKYSDHPKKISRLCAPFCGGCLRYQTKEAQTG